MISLYRGELHKVKGVPRQWTAPKSTIPVSVFIKYLKKRKVAVLRELQSSSSPEKLLFPSFTTLVKPGESIKLASYRVARELVQNDNVASGLGYGRVACFVEESKHATLVSQHMESSDRIEEVSEILQEKQRKKSDDTREDRKTANDDGEQTDAENQQILPTLQGKDSVREFELMALDVVDQSEDMDCDILGVEKTGPDSVDVSIEQGRVRVSEAGTTAEVDMDRGKHVESNDGKVEKVMEFSKNGEQSSPLGRGDNNHPIAGPTSAINVSRKPDDFSNDTNFGDVVGEKVSEKSAIKRKREEFQAKLEKLTADKHHLVLMLKQVLNEEESKRRVSSANAPQHTGLGVTGAIDAPVVTSHGEARGVLQPSGDLEEGELEYARTPSPPSRPIQSNHSNLNSLNVLGPPPSMVPILGRQNTLTQHISQGSSGRGGYYVPGTGIPPSPVGPGIGGGGALSPGAVYMGNLPSPLGPHNYSHNLALQHAAAIHAQKIVPVTPVHGQFNPMPPNGASLGAGPGVAGGPPGFGGYVVSPSLHPHHPHLSQTAASSTSHIPVQQGVVSSSLLTTPRGPVGYHDMRLGGNTWIPR